MRSRRAAEGSQDCRSRTLHSRSPPHATPVNTGRSTTRRSSPTQSRSASCLLARAAPTTSLPPASYTTCSKRPKPPARKLQRRFGTRVVRLVESVSDDPSVGDYRQRKRQLRDRVARADPDALAIFAADKISKVRELALQPASRLHEPDARAKLAHYGASLKLLRQVARQSALVDHLDAELEPARRPHDHRELITTTAQRQASRARSATSIELTQSESRWHAPTTEAVPSVRVPRLGRAPLPHRWPADNRHASVTSQRSRAEPHGVPVSRPERGAALFVLGSSPSRSRLPGGGGARFICLG